jgi:hypothetical protein
MDRPAQVKGRIFGRQFAGQDKISVLETTDLAETHGTDISASVAFDAFIELVQPVTQPLLLVHALDFLQTLALRNPFRLLPYHPI